MKTDEKPQARKFRSPTKVIICDAGDGTRCIPFTKDMPKGRLPIGGLDATVERIAKNGKKAGIKDIILVVRPEDYSAYNEYFNKKYSDLEDKLHASRKWEQLQRLADIPKVTLIAQRNDIPYGNAAPIVSAKHLVDDDEAVIVCYGDDIVFRSSDIQTMIDAYAAHPDADGIIMAQEIAQKDVKKFGMIKLKKVEGHDVLDHIVEKPQPGSEPSLLASYGRYLLTPTIMQILDNNRHKAGQDGEIWTVDAITEAAKAGKVYVEKTKGEWMTTGNERNYQMAFVEGALGEATENEDISFLEEVKARAERHLSKFKKDIK